MPLYRKIMQSEGLIRFQYWSIVSLIPSVKWRKFTGLPGHLKKLLSRLSLNTKCVQLINEPTSLGDEIPYLYIESRIALGCTSPRKHSGLWCFMKAWYSSYSYLLRHDWRKTQNLHADKCGEIWWPKLVRSLLGEWR